ncbi:MAG: plasmid mobilization relaxosome protein MobC, partial [Sulfurihydrogenibium sp.]
KKQTGLEKEIEYELNKMGVNLNQMARALNILLNILMKKKRELEERDRKILKTIDVRLKQAIKELKGVKDVFRRSNNQN